MFRASLQIVRISARVPRARFRTVHRREGGIIALLWQRCALAQVLSAGPRMVPHASGVTRGYLACVPGLRGAVRRACPWNSRRDALGVLAQFHPG